MFLLCGRQILYHWTARKVPKVESFKQILNIEMEKWKRNEWGKSGNILSLGVGSMDITFFPLLHLEILLTWKKRKVRAVLEAGGITQSQDPMARLSLLGWDAFWTPSRDGRYVVGCTDVDSGRTPGLQRGGGGELATWRRHLKPQVWMSWRSEHRSRKGDGQELGSAPQSPDPEKWGVRAQGPSGPLCNPLRCLSDGRALRSTGAVGHIPCHEGSGETRPGWWLVWVLPSGGRVTRSCELPDRLQQIWTFCC